MTIKEMIQRLQTFDEDALVWVKDLNAANEPEVRCLTDQKIEKIYFYPRSAERCPQVGDAIIVFESPYNQ